MSQQRQKNTSDIEQSEQVEVSANKLQILMAQHQNYKEQSVKEFARLKAQLKAKDEQLRLCMDALNKMKTMKSSRMKGGVGTERVMKEMSHAKEFDDWLAKNKDKLVEQEYEKFYKSEVDDFSKKLEQMFK
jgi:uncharacterized protein HemX